MNQNGKRFSSQILTDSDQDERVRDAIQQIRVSIDRVPKYVLDADIAKCFDKIDHNALLNKLGYNGKVRQQIKAWLKSGVIDNNTFLITEEVPYIQVINSCHRF